jgi:hypothetical protein
VNSRLVMLTLITHFAAGARRPRTAVALRLTLATLTAWLLGYAVATSLDLHRLPPLPDRWLGSLIMTAGFILTGLVMLAMGHSGPQSSSYERWLTTLPLQRWLRLALRALPLAVIVGLVWLFALPVLTALPLPHAAVWFAAGSLTGAWLSVRGHGLRAIVLYLGATVGALESLRQNRPELVWAMLGCSLLAAVWPWPSWHWPAPALTLGRRPLRHWWFLLKLLRNRRTFTALAFGLALTTCSAVIISLRQAAAVGGAGWLILSAIISATIACDIRGLSARHKAPELEALGGLQYFLMSQFRAALTVALLPALPLVILLALSHLLSLQTLVFAVTLQLAAAMLGLLAGALFVPGARDVGSQFFAAVLSSGILLGLPRAAHLTDLAALTAAWLGVATLAVIVTWLIEINRRSTYASL